MKALKLPAGKANQPNSVRALFQTKPLTERLLPILAELLSSIAEPDRRKKASALPAYCLNIFQALRATQFRVLPSSANLVDEAGTLDWDAIGRVIGAGLRCCRFAELELSDVVQREVALAQDTVDLCEVLSAIPGLGHLIKPAMPLIAEPSLFIKGSDELWTAMLATSQAAYQRGRDPLIRLTEAIQKGVAGFLDEEGRCVSEHARDNIYWFLLIIWPEVQAMQQAHPPISRRDFAGWLEPFSRAGLVNIRDLDQLLDVCDDIGLKFKGRGAPRKK